MNDKKFEFNEKDHIYTLDGKPLYGVTSVLGVIAKPALIQWSANMACEFINSHRLGGSINLTTGEEVVCFEKGFETILKEAKQAHKKKKENSADIGTKVHKAIEEWIKEKKEPELDEQGMTMFNHFIKWQEDKKILESELRVYNEDWWVAGTIDLVFEYKGKTYIGDIKTYSGIYDRTPFLQCAGYAGMYKATTGKELEGSCIIRLGKDGSFEEKWSYDLVGDQKGFINALGLFKCLESYKTK